MKLQIWSPLLKKSLMENFFFVQFKVRKRTKMVALNLMQKVCFELWKPENCLRQTFQEGYSVRFLMLLFSVILLLHSHKKRKDSLEGSLGRVFFAAELDFPKILETRVPQNSSNVNIECVGKSKQLYSLCDQLLGSLMYLLFIILILICF